MERLLVAINTSRKINFSLTLPLRFLSIFAALHYSRDMRAGRAFWGITEYLLTEAECEKAAGAAIPLSLSAQFGGVTLVYIK